MVRNTDLLNPLRVAVMTIQPGADGWMFAVKTALMEPWGIVTVAGTVMLSLLLERLTTMSPADLVMATVHVRPVPGATLDKAVVNESRRGVDHSVRVAV